ncbi:RHS repeat-associated core domain-containing protein [Actinoplanes sp. CA-030573]|uniref:RHS repeat-associated core domain-containing protein n=1 Tax=Actinoplanes sp. CA-030573 TaxID=3239898 RepID=UPI003D8E421F
MPRIAFAALVSLLAPLAVAPTAAPAATAQARPEVHPAQALDFGPDAARSADVALDGHGDQDGYHLLVGRESAGFAWREVAVLRPAGRDESSWTGYQCLSGDGRYAAVAILPISGANSAAARDHGGFAYSVDLASGKVHPVAKGVGVKYFSPGCGAGDDAIFTLYVGAQDEDTRLLRADLATGRVTTAVTVDGQVTSSVPLPKQIVGVRGHHLVSVAGGKAANLAAVEGTAYDLRPTADGVAYLQAAAGATTATAMHYRSGRTTRLGVGPLARMQLFAGRSGHPLLAGATSTDLASNTGVRKVDDKPLTYGATAASLDGHALQGAQPGETLATRTGKVVRTEQPDGAAVRTTTATAAYTATAAVAATQTPTCAVPRLDPAKQAMQPNAAQVNWAIQMAEQGLLTGSAYTRPAGFANMGLAAYAPNSDFPKIGLQHPAADSWNSVPRSVYDAIVAQESNWSQASWHSAAGVAGNPLIADYYGAAGDIRSINYAAADCGYGLGQVTSGMHVGDTAYSVNGQTKIAVDYQENIAAGLQILENTWNQLYTAGITANDGSPRYLENWYFAIWAYNSGIQPNAANGNTTGCTPGPTCTGPEGTWGLGWSNNPANPDYSPSRPAYLKNTYADAEHPNSWPYQERVLGWMAQPLQRYSADAYARPTYHNGKTWVQPAPFTTMCTVADNHCDPNGQNTSNPGAGHCMLDSYRCWWHKAVSWLDCPTNCATSAYEVGSGSSEPANPSRNPPTCSLDTSKVAANAIIVDDEPNRRNLQGCGAANWTSNGTFTYAYGKNAAGDPIGAIDTHQLGSGLGGRVLFTHTQNGSEPSLINTGTWTPVLPKLQYYKIKLHIPAMGARATNVVYTINPGGGVSPWRIRVNQAWNSEQWVTIGTFAMQNGGNVVLTNKGSSIDNGGFANSDFDVAFDAVAFIPQGGTPGKPIGGPPGIKDAPRGSNPAYIACGCARRTAGDPVDTSTGYFGQAFTDLTTPGRGMSLAMTRSYAEGIADPNGPNKTLAENGAFGYGWSYGYDLRAITDATTGDVTVRQEDGSSVPFTNTSGTYAPAAPRFDATLVKSGSVYTYTRRNQEIFTFDAATGRLTAETDVAGSKAVPAYKTSLTYDTAGHLTTVTDPAARSYTLTWTGSHITAVADQTGRKVTYSYNAAGDLTDVTYPDGGHEQYAYQSGTHVMTSMRTPANAAGPASAVTSMTYDSAERVTAQTDPTGRTTSFTYAPNGGLTTGQVLVTDPSGHKDLQTYENGLLISETKGYGTADAGTASYTYDPATLGVTTQTDADGNMQTYTYDDRGNVTSASDAQGFTTNYMYDDANNLIEKVDANGVATVNGYDQNNQLTSTTVTEANNVVESVTGNFGPEPVRTANFYYDDAAHPADRTRSVDSRGKTTKTTYDAYGDVKTVTDPLGNVTTYGYDTGRSWLTSLTDANTKTTSYQYDLRGRRTKVTDALNKSVTTTYDADGNTTGTTDANGNATTIEVDAAGRVVKSTRAGGISTTTHYNPDGSIADTVDGLGAKTTYGYDGQGRGVSRKDADNKTNTVKLDPAGRTVSRVDPAGRTTTIGTDVLGRTTSVTYSDGKTPKVTYAYDPTGRMISRTDGTGTSTWKYDVFGDLVAQTQGSGATVTYGYDNGGNQTSILYPGQTKAVARTFDDDGRLATVTDPAGNKTSFGYTKTGLVQTTAYPNGVTVTNGYDDRGSLTSTAAGTLVQLAWGRDNIGQVSSRKVGTAAAEAATYNPREEVSALGSTAFAYDAADNPTTVGTATQAFDPAGRLCWSQPSGAVTNPTCGTVPSGATAYTFDDLGNRLTAGTTKTFAYDQASRLTSYTGPGGSGTYKYDGDGLRTSKTVGGVTTTFVWDGNATPNLLSDGSTIYLYGPDGTPIEQVGAAGTAFYVHDQVGSTMALLTSTGTVGATFAYTAYGTATRSGTLDTPLRYTGQYTDAESGLVYLRARYYDPATTEFLTVDPLVDTTRQPYLYSGDNPLNYTDPTGRSFWGTLGTGLMIVGAAVAVGGCIVLEPCGAAALVVGGGVVITDAVALGGIALLGAAGGWAIGNSAMHSSAASGGWDPSWEDMDWDSGDEDDDGYRTSHSREAQQQQADAAWAEIKRRARMVGKDLTEADKRRWHDAITKKGGDYNDILKEGLKLFCED